MIDLEKLVPLPDRDSVSWSYCRLERYTASQMAAFRQQVAQEVARRCERIAYHYASMALSMGAKEKMRTAESIQGAIAAEFGLGDAWRSPRSSSPTAPRPAGPLECFRTTARSSASGLHQSLRLGGLFAALPQLLGSRHDRLQAPHAALHLVRPCAVTVRAFR